MEVTFRFTPLRTLSLGIKTCPLERFTKEDINTSLQYKFGITVINFWNEIRQKLRLKIPLLRSTSREMMYRNGKFISWPGSDVRLN
jgi:hypothetical protein